MIHSAHQHDEEEYAGDVMASVKIMMAVQKRLTASGWRRWRSEVDDADVANNDEENLTINYHLARDAAEHYS